MSQRPSFKIHPETARALLEMRRDRSCEEFEAWKRIPALEIQVRRATLRMHRFAVAVMRRSMENPTPEEIMASCEGAAEFE